MPRESLVAPEDLPKQALRQVAPGQLEPEVPGMSHETRAGLEEPLLQARQGPALDGDGQGEPAQEIAQVVGDDPEQEADLIRPEAVAGEDVGPNGARANLQKSTPRFYCPLRTGMHAAEAPE